MPGKTGFDFNGSSQAFNVLATYLFGKVIRTFVLLLEWKKKNCGSSCHLHKS